DFSMGAVGGTVSNKSSGWPDEIMSCGTGCLPGGPMMDPKNPGAEPASDSPLVPWFLATRGRLFGTLFLVLALPMGGLGFLAAEQARRALREQALAQNIEVVSHRQPLRAAVARKDAEGAREHLRDLVDLSPAIDRAYVTDPSGIEWSDYPPDPQAIGLNLTVRDWFQGASRTKGTYVSAVYRRRG